ncbi:MAG: VOC family protein [Acidimicrobiia bacterium]|nr:VOC family protein [Acidimicrobiia bacterium]
MLSLSTIQQIAVVVHDTPRAVAFYRDVLGMTLLFEAPPSLAFFDCGGVRLMLGPASSPEFDQRSFIYYHVADIQAAAQELEARGVTFDETPHIVAKLPSVDVWLAIFRDPDRNVVGLMSEVPR